MTKSECSNKRQITLNLAKYLGVEIDIPECRSNNCPDGECPRCSGDNKILAKALLSPDLTEEERNRVKKESISFGVYSFFTADDCDVLGVKRKMSDPGLDVYSKVIESMAKENSLDTDDKSDTVEDSEADIIEEPQEV